MTLADAHFGEVVVVGGHPEHRHHGRAATLFEEPSRLEGGQRLVEDVQGSTEEPRLLAGDHGHRPRVTEQRRSRRGPRRPPCLLLSDEGRHYRRHAGARE